VSNAAIGESGPISEIPVDLVRRTFVSSVGGFVTAYGLGAYCASKHAVEGIAAAMRDELSTTGITVQTINPGPYDTGFNDRMADTTYHWHDDTVHLTRESDIRAHFAAIMKGQFDPQEMIDKMVEVIGADNGLYRNAWPPATETLMKQVEERTWTLRTAMK
jgi:NAD(P)-dependent dehydrogenase (short-subunit alcohol dehydrogenase family)